MGNVSRRTFMQAALLGAAVAGQGMAQPVRTSREPESGDRPEQDVSVTLLNPRNRVPVSLIIDDSTCLVNLAHFGIPQFAEVRPERYQQSWRTLPREIPDSFVRKFAEWCSSHGVKGKYSLVPYPACVGWLDRFLPGWSKQELEASLDLVQTLLVPDWDIHPEGISHLRAIDTKTGRPYPEASDAFMENWGWSNGKSVDELTDYLTYQLRILENVGMYCEGITTPGGFGRHVQPELAQAVLQSCRNVHRVEIPHYFHDVITEDESVVPRVYYASGLGGSDPECVVSLIACTDDWFGGWDGLQLGSPDQCITEDFNGGRLPDVIARGEPAVLLCHWPGIYFNGEEKGFQVFQEVVGRLHAAYDNLLWMKLSEIARYWAARELTRVERIEDTITFHAPYACIDFTVHVAAAPNAEPQLISNGTADLRRASGPLDLNRNSWHADDKGVMLCFDLPKGQSQIALTTV